MTPNSLLASINSPQDLRSLSADQLPLLASEIREQIIQVVSQNGGHLASSLGAVELTLALHYTFDTPHDKIVWDVGHQTYTHKLITGRREAFHTIRQENGLSGFPKREESPYDAFNTGHASTSISAALGLAEGMYHRGERNHSIAVIGDGSMTGGMAFEAVNNAGIIDRNLIVILNDNEMSISPNVGALSHYLNRIITGQPYHQLKKDIDHSLSAIPNVGKQMLHAVVRMKDAVKMLVVPTTLFDEMGFEYFGPIPGHNIKEMIETLEAIKKLEGPIILHLVTKKGKGYPPAETQPHSFHSAAPFDIESGCFKKKNGVPSYTDFFADALAQLGEQDSRIIAISAAMPEGTGTNKFAKLFPGRFYDVGIAEQHAVTFAAGLAVEKLRPVVAIYSTFLQRAYDQIVHDVCMQNLPVTFCLDRGGIVGADGPTHHGIFDYAYLRHIPNMLVMAPKDENELRHMLYTATQQPCPCSLRYPRDNGIGVPLDTEFKPLAVGKAEILQTGQDVVLLAIGNMVYPALEAAKILSSGGIEATVVNARFIKPLDKELICRLVKEIGCLVTIEEGCLPGGFGSAVLELLQEEGISSKITRLGIADLFIEHGNSANIRRRFKLNPAGIAETARNLCNI
ncbi:MAG: 1-deoxy-D-xylulose-5-phosphate synthase [Candidatus Schekmanbacteria bacterium]|nr:1-deoxy-D-xylulose-5-phosphate synthase [Candidatus Schekmanbacteria bacterium]